MTDSAAEILERWERSGGTFKIRSLSADAAEIQLCTCYGEPVDELLSRDPRFVAQMAERLRAQR